MALNATVGVDLREYDVTLDSETGKVELSANLYNAWSMVTGGGVPTCVDIAYDSREAICYLQARGNKAFQPMNGDLSEAPVNWGVYLAKFQLPKTLESGVDSLEAFGADENSHAIRLAASSGAIIIENSGEGALVSVYDIAGRLAARVDAPTGRTSVALPAGLYIAAGQKLLVK